MPRRRRKDRRISPLGNVDLAGIAARDRYRETLFSCDHHALASRRFPFEYVQHWHMSHGDTPKRLAIFRMAAMVTQDVPFSYFWICCHATLNAAATSLCDSCRSRLSDLRRAPMTEFKLRSTTRPMMYSYSFWLPFPPSANRLWRYGAGGKVYLSTKYSKFPTNLDGFRSGRLPQPEQNTKRE